MDEGRGAEDGSDSRILIDRDDETRELKSRVPMRYVEFISVCARISPFSTCCVHSSSEGPAETVGATPPAQILSVSVRVVGA